MHRSSDLLLFASLRRLELLTVPYQLLLVVLVLTYLSSPTSLIRPRTRTMTDPPLVVQYA